MKLYFKTFAVLDIISILILSNQVWVYLQNIQHLPPEWRLIFKVIGTIVIYISLFATTYGLFFFKKIGAYIYYVQFPFRIFLWIFSIGFISQAMEWFNLDPSDFNIIFKICMVAEFIRLYFTILIHRKYIQTTP